MTCRIKQVPPWKALRLSPEPRRDPYPGERLVYHLTCTYDTNRGVHTHMIDFREYQLGLQVRDIEVVVNKLLGYLDSTVNRRYATMRRISCGLYKRPDTTV